MTKRIARFLVLTALTVCRPVLATVQIFPTFSIPVVTRDAILIAGPDSRRLLCLEPSGAVRWTHDVRELSSFGSFDDRDFFVQDGRRVFRLNARTGAPAPLITLGAEEAIAIDPQANIAWSASTGVSKRFVFRDPHTLRPLWRDDRIESVTAFDDKSLYALTAVRHPDAESEGFTMSDATIRKVDRTTGRTIWSHALHDGQTIETRGTIIGGYLAIVDGYMPTSVTVLDTTSGKVVRDVASTDWGSRGVFDVDKKSADEAFVLETMRTPDPDRLTTVSFPDLSPKSSIALPAKENLFFYIEGDVLVTSGIYSAAGFNLIDGTKLWEIGHQVLMTRPVHGALYASRSDRKNDVAILESIDLQTGAETIVYSEPLPESLTAAVRERAEKEWREKADKERAARDKARNAEEEKLRPAIGSEICLRYDRSGMLDIREYWILQKDGTAEYVDADRNSPAMRMRGRWWKTSDGGYEIRGTPLVRSVETERLSVDIGVNANIPLLADLRDVLEAFVQTHSGNVTAEDLRTLAVRAPGCPPEASPYCSGENERLLDVFARDPIKPDVSVSDLASLIEAIDRYRKNLADADVLRFRLRSYRRFTFADWIDAHSYWRHKPGDAESEIDSSEVHAPAMFIVAPCSEVAETLHGFGNAIVIEH
jgi:hypothetical protein